MNMCMTVNNMCLEICCQIAKTEKIFKLDAQFSPYQNYLKKSLVALNRRIG